MRNGSFILLFLSIVQTKLQIGFQNKTHEFNLHTEQVAGVFCFVSIFIIKF